MSSERADQPATPDNSMAHGNPGQVLAAQREAMGWSVEQVADQLKLAVRQVVALEAGDYASLPSPAVTRGFVRAYAKLLKMDPAPLVSQIAIETVPTVDPNAPAPRRASPASFSESRFPTHGKRSKLPLGLIAAAVVVIAAGAAAWRAGLIPVGVQHADTNVATPASGPSAETGSAATSSGSATETLASPSVPLISTPGAASADATNAASAAPPAAPPAPVTAPATTATTAPAPAPATVAPPAPAPVQAAPAAPAPAAAAPGGGPNALVLNVREDSWIEVRPAKGGAPLISRLVKGGSTETVDVNGPVRVVVGNPSGVTATLRGNAVALPQVPGKTISRVNLE